MKGTAITLEEEIALAKEHVELYRSIWFLPNNGTHSRHRQRTHWSSTPENWRRWLSAHAILRRLRNMRKLRDIVFSAK